MRYGSSLTVILRKLGMAKTPDILLEVPVSIQLQEYSFFSLFYASHSWLTISWIDSKAMFGDPYWYIIIRWSWCNRQIQHEEQLLSYVNRFGNGCVFYVFFLLSVDRASGSGLWSPNKDSKRSLLWIISHPNISPYNPVCVILKQWILNHLFWTKRVQRKHPIQTKTQTT